MIAIDVPSAADELRDTATEVEKRGSRCVAGLAAHSVDPLLQAYSRNKNDSTVSSNACFASIIAQCPQLGKT